MQLCVIRPRPDFQSRRAAPEFLFGADARARDGDKGGVARAKTASCPGSGYVVSGCCGQRSVGKYVCSGGWESRYEGVRLCQAHTVVCFAWLIFFFFADGW